MIRLKRNIKIGYVKVSKIIFDVYIRCLFVLLVLYTYIQSLNLPFQILYFQSLSRVSVIFMLNFCLNILFYHSRTLLHGHMFTKWWNEIVLLCIEHCLWTCNIEETGRLMSVLKCIQSSFILADFHFQQVDVKLI